MDSVSETAQFMTKRFYLGGNAVDTREVDVGDKQNFHGKSVVGLVWNIFLMRVIPVFSCESFLLSYRQAAMLAHYHFCLS